MRGWLPNVLLVAVGLGIWAGVTPSSPAQPPAAYQLSPYFYYPYHYYPHNYWPAMGPRWPERPEEPYLKAPAYMAYPPFKEYNWRHEYWAPQKYYRGFHFWLDQF